MENENALNQEILKVISEKLPALQVKAITECFEQNKQLKSQNTYYESDITNLRKERDGLKNKITNLNAENNDLSNKLLLAGNLSQRELFLDKTILEIKLAEAEKRSNDIFNLTAIAFKTPDKIRAFSENRMFTGSISYDNTGKQSYPPNSFNSHITETESNV